jgi:hypothetical protein
MSSDADEARVRALMGEISRAFVERDVAALEPIFDDSFTLTDPDGDVVSKERWLDELARGSLVVESVRSDTFDIRRVGDSFRVKGQLTIRASRYNGTFTYLGVYAKHAGAWKLLLSSARRVRDE